MTFPGQGRGQPPYISERVQPISADSIPIMHILKLVHPRAVIGKSHELQWQMPRLEHMMPETNVRGRSRLYE
ncbi:hypothetical protein B2I21_14350 [Chryseobacterium mucoviscidosis]|nr:hypothetical protein B2I21_14350 [Chryseobacterium mucoviscidosis]